MQNSRGCIGNDNDGPLAYLNSKSFTAWKDVRDLEGVVVHAVIPANHFSEADRSHSSGGEHAGTLLCDFNFYGPQNIGEQVGKLLAKTDCFLQEPKHLAKHIVYDNPQCLKFPAAIRMKVTNLLGVSGMGDISQVRRAYALFLKASTEY